MRYLFSFYADSGRIALQSILVSVPLGILAGLAGSWALLRRDVLALVGR